MEHLRRRRRVFGLLLHCLEIHHGLFLQVIVAFQLCLVGEKLFQTRCIDKRICAWWCGWRGAQDTDIAEVS